MRKDIVLFVLVLSFSLIVSSCDYGGYEFEITELSYTPPNRTSEIIGGSESPDDEYYDNDDPSGTSEGSIRTTGGGRSQQPQTATEGFLEVNVVNPANAMISVNGEIVGTSSIVHELQPGTYMLEVEAQGYSPYVSNVIINPRSERKFTIRLYPEWLPAEERIAIDSFSSNLNQVRQGETIVISSLFSGPPDVLCNILIDGREVNTLSERNSEHLTSHAFQNPGRKEIELRCSGMVGEQSQVLTLNVHECLTDEDCLFRCQNNVCVEDYDQRIGLQVEYFDRIFLWFGRWREYEGAELKPRSRVRMIVTELPQDINCGPIGADFNVQENSRSKPLTLTSPAVMGVICDNGQEEIVNVNVRVESGIIGELIE